MSLRDSLHEELTQINNISYLIPQLISLGMAIEADSYSLELLSQSIAQYTLLLFKVSYTTVTEAQGGNLHSILCHEDAIMLGSDVHVVIVQGDITAVTRSGIPSLKIFIRFLFVSEIKISRNSRHYSCLFDITHIYLTLDSCECRQVLQTQADGSGEMTSSGGSGGVLEPQSEQCPVDLDIQNICNGTLASPCDCDSTSECQVCSECVVSCGTISFFTSPSY